MAMKMIPTSATDPDGYVACPGSCQRACAEALRETVRAARPHLEQRLRWGHLAR